MMKDPCCCAWAITSVLLTVLSPLASAEEATTRSIVLLHTNDIHDHIRPRADGRGGLPYVAGYVQQERAERDDVVLLDAGDWLEKGELVSFKTSGRTTVQAMNRIGFDVAVVGNHDFNFGYQALLDLQEVATFPMVTANLPQGNPMVGRFPASAVVERNGVRLGVIGISRNFMRAEFKNALPPAAYGFNTGNGPFGDRFIQHTVRAVQKEVRKLAGNVDLLIGLAHAGTSECQQFAEAVPELQILIGGHTNELTEQPIVAESSGALIVEAGSWAEFVGRLELNVDVAANKIVSWDYGLMRMKRGVTPLDTDLADWVTKQEQMHAPEALEIVCHSRYTLDHQAVAGLIADALQVETNADIGLAHAESVRGLIVAGDVDHNAIFQTWVPGPARRQVLHVSMTGQEIRDLIDAGQSDGAGRSDAQFSAALPDALEPGRTYRVAIPGENWFDKEAGGLVQQLRLHHRESRVLGKRVDQFLADYLTVAGADALRAVAQ